MPPRPRILLHAFSTFNLGGPQARFVQLANEFGQEYEHIVAAMDDCFIAGERLNSDVRWEPLRLEIRKGGALANRTTFRKVLQARKPDLLLSYNWGAIEWAAANIPSLVPHVHVEDGFGPEEAERQLPRRVWMRRLLLAARRVPVVVASRRLEGIACKQWWMSPRRVRFIPNGVEIPTEDDSKKDRQQPLTIGTVAGLRPEKNVARLIKAFATVRREHDARLVVVGDGPERGNLEALADALGIRRDVEFTGYLKNPQDRLKGFDLFALSSDTEQLPIAMLEAMAHGVPCVATRVGDVEEIVPATARKAVAAPDDADFERTLLWAMGNRDRWPQWVAASREVVARSYGMPQMLEAWRNLFDGN